MRSPSIVPLSQVPRDAAERYLVAQGNSPAVVAWKYFDDEFNRGRERGMAWVQDGVVRGFIGLIPFALRGGAERIPAVWSCDWSLEAPDRTPGMGILLLKAAIESSGLLVTFNGNERTDAILPRVASRTIADAGVRFLLPLRAGYYAGRAAARYPALAAARAPLGWIPLPAALRRPAGRVEVERGVSGAIAPLLDADGDGAAVRPSYELGYLEWQCGRCPEIEAWTCAVAAAGRGSAVRAAVLVWRSARAGADWKMALWGAGDAAAARSALLAGCRVAARHGAESVTAMVARADAAAVALLAAAGFRRSRTPVALYFSEGRGAAPAPTGAIGGLSALDTDMAYLG
jgi:hypothetical protein